MSKICAGTRARSNEADTAGKIILQACLTRRDIRVLYRIRRGNGRYLADRKENNGEFMKNSVNFRWLPALPAGQRPFRG